MIKITDTKTHDIAQDLNATIKHRSTPIPFGTGCGFQMTLEEIVIFVAERLQPLDLWTPMRKPGLGELVVEDWIDDPTK